MQSEIHEAILILSFMFCFNYSSNQQDKERHAGSKRSLSFESKFESGNLRKAIQVTN